jgi:hypothetical protein
LLNRTTVVITIARIITGHSNTDGHTDARRLSDVILFGV